VDNSPIHAPGEEAMRTDLYGLGLRARWPPRSSRRSPMIWRRITPRTASA